MITALDTNGSAYFSLSHVKTNQDTFMLFMRHLVAKLESESPGWREDSVVLIDNAQYHKGQEIRSYFLKMQVPIIYSGPYSFSAAPIETMFGNLKLGDLNAANIPNGRR